MTHAFWMITESTDSDPLKLDHKHIGENREFETNTENSKWFSGLTHRTKKKTKLMIPECRLLD